MLEEGSHIGLGLFPTTLCKNEGDSTTEPKLSSKFESSGGNSKTLERAACAK